MKLEEEAATKGRDIRNTNAVMQVPQVVAENQVGGPTGEGEVWVRGIPSFDVGKEGVIHCEVGGGKGGAGGRGGREAAEGKGGAGGRGELEMVEVERGRGAGRCEGRRVES